MTENRSLEALWTTAHMFGVLGAIIIKKRIHFSKPVFCPWLETASRERTLPWPSVAAVHADMEHEAALQNSKYFSRDSL